MCLVCSHNTASYKKKTSGKNGSMYGKVAPSTKKYWYDMKDGSKVFLRSNWEYLVAKHLDETGKKWQYEPMSFPVTIAVDGKDKNTSYVPDFYIVDDDCYLEVKGWWRNIGSKEKIEEAKKVYGINVKMIMKKEMLELGLLQRENNIEKREEITSKKGNTI